MPGLPKAIIKKYGVSKEAWRIYRGQKRKPNKVQRASTTGTTMPRKRRVSRVRRRVRRYGRSIRRRWRKVDKRIPISGGAGLAVSILASPGDGFGSAFEKVQAGSFDQAFQSFLSSWTGVNLGGIGGQGETEFDLMKSINPLDLSRAPAWKTTFWTALLFKGIKMLGVKDPMKNIPFIGKYAKMS